MLINSASHIYFDIFIGIFRFLDVELTGFTRRKGRILHVKKYNN